ncbi:LolC/E family lipoprotein releasing system, transmembrane protein [Hyphomicrobium denitrificans 1NES1]|uniref:LolC/E family lipoprotein releasing system, transmembrane protein n=1 Tax=Hyphomicrobium denitrificans 1NES1 TaxID=670307 RepID=N0BAA8_9HYPH|nr:lipoprotein-releasing ABC transporter permease subunit [Hyphomicrobium denitrificans]AGK57466.1 LolC/E family lipoprotein releasing system, transmembrane protein [Hyphomicrobium denitrificans 1NES1]
MTTTAVRDTKPFSSFEWMIAGRYLRARRKEGFISVIAGFSFLGIMLGVATLIIVMAVMNGFRHDLFSKIMGLNGHVIVQKLGDRFDDYEQMAEKIKQVPGVQVAMPVIEGQVMVSSSSQALGGLVRGVREADLKSLKLVSGNVRAGTLDGFDKQTGIAMGIRLANQLHVGLGDSVTLVSPRGAATPFGTAPRSKAYQITSIFELGMSEYDRMMIFMPLGEAQKYFSKNGEVDVVEVVVNDPENVDSFRAEILKAGGPSIAVADWRQRNETFFNVLSVERNVMFIILSLIVLVAALNIISGLMMLVKDKGRDIAILRTMGATKGAVMRVFLITGASIGVVGTLAGLMLGVIFCWNIDSIKNFASWVTGTTVFDPSVYYLTKLPADIDPHETGGIVIMALVLSVIATLYPSWRASRLDPVEALRYE